MSVTSVKSSSCIQAYLGVQLTEKQPFLKFKDKTHVTSCALGALKEFSKPVVEQEVILDLLIRKLERQDISDPKLTEGLDAEEVKFVRGEVDHLLGCVFKSMEDKHLNAEQIRKARHDLALELGRHKSHHFPKSLSMIKEFDHKLDERNKKLARKEADNPLAAAAPDLIEAASEAWMKSKDELKKSAVFSNLTHDEQNAVLKGAKTPRFGLSREVFSTYLLQNPVAVVTRKGMSLGMDIKRQLDYVSAQIRGKELFKPLSPSERRDFESVDHYLHGFLEALGGTEKPILDAWEACKQQPFDKAFSQFYHQLSEGKLGDKGKHVAHLFSAMAQNHYVAPGTVALRQLQPAGAFGPKKGGMGVAYRFDRDGVAVTSYFTIARKPEAGKETPDCQIKIVNTMNSSLSNPASWTSKIEAVVEVPVGPDDKATRDRLKLIDKMVVQPLLDAGFHVRVSPA